MIEFQKKKEESLNNKDNDRMKSYRYNFSKMIKSRSLF